MVIAVTGTLLATLLPPGRMLAMDEWRARHRVLVAVLACHVPLAFGLSADGSVGVHRVTEIAVLGVLAGLAMVAVLPRVVREATVCLGLVLSAALVVHLWHGDPVAHFHFFALLALLTAYQRWLPFLLFIGLVFAHHVLAGLRMPEEVFGPEAGEDPLRLALVHALYLVGAAVSAMWVWRVTAHSYDRVHRQVVRVAAELDGALGATGEAVLSVTPEGTCGFVNAAAAELLGLDVVELQGQSVHEAFHAPGPVPPDCATCEAVRVGRQVRIQDRIRRSDGVLLDIDVDVRPRADQPGAAVLVVHPHTSACPRELTLLADLRRALVRDELVLHFQPRVSLLDGRCTGLEALVRWQHPEQGFLPPSMFVPLAEQHGLIPELDAWVLRAAVAQAALWAADGHSVAVAVNLSARSLCDTTLPGRVSDVLQAAALPASALEVEVTETAVMENPRTAHAVLDSLRNLGVAVAIDDFGVGYASLTYLRDLPVDVVKVDRSFVSRVVDDPASRAIVGATVGLAHALGKSVVAEGIEHAESADVLVNLGVTVAQGYLYGRPVPAGELDLARPAVAAH